MANERKCLTTFRLCLLKSSECTRSLIFNDEFYEREEFAPFIYNLCCRSRCIVSTILSNFPKRRNIHDFKITFSGFY